MLQPSKTVRCNRSTALTLGILTLQNEKRELADAALSGTAVKNMKLTMADIMSECAPVVAVLTQPELFQRSTDK